MTDEKFRVTWGLAEVSMGIASPSPLGISRATLECSPCMPHRYSSSQRRSPHQLIPQSAESRLTILQDEHSRRDPVIPKAGNWADNDPPGHTVTA